MYYFSQYSLSLSLFFSVVCYKNTIFHCTWKLQAFHLNIVWITCCIVSNRELFIFTNNWWARLFYNLFLLSVDSLSIFWSVEYCVWISTFNLLAISAMNFWTLSFLLFNNNSTIVLVYFFSLVKKVFILFFGSFTSKC